MSGGGGGVVNLGEESMKESLYGVGKFIFYYDRVGNGRNFATESSRWEDLYNKYGLQGLEDRVDKEPRRPNGFLYGTEALQYTETAKIYQQSKEYHLGNRIRDTFHDTKNAPHNYHAIIQNKYRVKISDLFLKVAAAADQKVGRGRINGLLKEWAIVEEKYTGRGGQIKYAEAREDMDLIKGKLESLNTSIQQAERAEKEAIATARVVTTATYAMERGGVAGYTQAVNVALAAINDIPRDQRNLKKFHKLYQTWEQAQDGKAKAEERERARLHLEKEKTERDETIAAEDYGSVFESYEEGKAGAHEILERLNEIEKATNPQSDINFVPLLWEEANRGWEYDYRTKSKFTDSGVAQQLADLRQKVYMKMILNGYQNWTGEWGAASDPKNKRPLFDETTTDNLGLLWDHWFYYSLDSDPIFIDFKRNFGVEVNFTHTHGAKTHTKNRITGYVRVESLSPQNTIDHAVARHLRGSNTKYWRKGAAAAETIKGMLEKEIDERRFIVGPARVGVVVPEGRVPGDTVTIDTPWDENATFSIPEGVVSGGEGGLVWGVIWLDGQAPTLPTIEGTFATEVPTYGEEIRKRAQFMRDSPLHIYIRDKIIKFIHSAPAKVDRMPNTDEIGDTAGMVGELCWKSFWRWVMLEEKEGRGGPVLVEAARELYSELKGGDWWVIDYIDEKEIGFVEERFPLRKAFYDAIGLGVQEYSGVKGKQLVEYADDLRKKWRKILENLPHDEERLPHKDHVAKIQALLMIVDERGSQEEMVRKIIEDTAEEEEAQEAEKAEELAANQFFTENNARLETEIGQLVAERDQMKKTDGETWHIYSDLRRKMGYISFSDFLLLIKNTLDELYQNGKITLNVTEWLGKHDNVTSIRDIFYKGSRGAPAIQWMDANKLLREVWARVVATAVGSVGPRFENEIAPVGGPLVTESNWFEYFRFIENLPKNLQKFKNLLGEGTFLEYLALAHDRFDRREEAFPLTKEGMRDGFHMFAAEEEVGLIRKELIIDRARLLQHYAEIEELFFLGYDAEITYQMEGDGETGTTIVSQVAALLASGDIDDSTEVKSDGMDEWEAWGVAKARFGTMDVLVPKLIEEFILKSFKDFICENEACDQRKSHTGKVFYTRIKKEGDVAAEAKINIRGDNSIDQYLNGAQDFFIIHIMNPDTGVVLEEEVRDLTESHLTAPWTPIGEGTDDGHEWTVDQTGLAEELIQHDLPPNVEYKTQKQLKDEWGKQEAAAALWHGFKATGTLFIAELKRETHWLVPFRKILFIRWEDQVHKTTVLVRGFVLANATDVENSSEGRPGDGLRTVPTLQERVVSFNDLYTCDPLPDAILNATAPPEFVEHYKEMVQLYKKVESLEPNNIEVWGGEGREAEAKIPLGTWSFVQEPIRLRLPEDKTAINVYRAWRRPAAEFSTPNEQEAAVRANPEQISPIPGVSWISGTGITGGGYTANTIMEWMWYEGYVKVNEKVGIIVKNKTFCESLTASVGPNFIDSRTVPYRCAASERKRDEDKREDHYNNQFIEMPPDILAPILIAENVGRDSHDEAVADQMAYLELGGSWAEEGGQEKKEKQTGTDSLPLPPATPALAEVVINAQKELEEARADHDIPRFEAALEVMRKAREDNVVADVTDHITWFEEKEDWLGKEAGYESVFNVWIGVVEKGGWNGGRVEEELKPFRDQLSRLPTPGFFKWIIATEKAAKWKFHVKEESVVAKYTQFIEPLIPLLGPEGYLMSLEAPDDKIEKFISIITSLDIWDNNEFCQKYFWCSGEEPDDCAKEWAGSWELERPSPAANIITKIFELEANLGFTGIIFLFNKLICIISSCGYEDAGEALVVTQYMAQFDGATAVLFTAEHYREAVGLILKNPHNIKIYKPLLCKMNTVFQQEQEEKALAAMREDVLDTIAAVVAGTDILTAEELVAELKRAKAMGVEDSALEAILGGPIPAAALAPDEESDDDLLELGGGNGEIRTKRKNRRNRKKNRRNRRKNRTRRKKTNRRRNVIKTRRKFR